MNNRGIDWGLALASLALSIFLWVVVQVQLGATTVRIPVKLKWQNQPSKTSVIHDIDTVEVETVATQDQRAWIEQNMDKFVAVIDLKGLSPGNYRLPVIFRPPANDELSFQLRTRRVPISIERLVTRTLAVTVSLKGELPPDKAWISQKLTPLAVLVTGPESAVADANAVVEMDKSHYQENMALRLPVRIVDKNNNPLPDLEIDPEQVTLTPVVQPSKTVVIGSVRLRHQEAGYRVSVEQPRDIRIYGPKALLDQLKEIRMPEIDLTGLKSTTTFTLKPELPSGVSSLDGPTVKVRVFIEPIIAAPDSTPGPISPNGEGNQLP